MFLAREGSSGEKGDQKEWMTVVLYCGFYLWVGVQNVLSISTLWARCADVFPSDVARRLFGFIAAGSTLGQLNGSFIAKIQIKILSKGPTFSYQLFHFSPSSSL